MKSRYLPFFALLALLLSCNFLASTPPAGPQQPTEIITEAPTEAVTEAPTEPPTEAPTEVITEAPTEAPVASWPLAYIGQDGNLWVLDTASGEARQLTTDAANPTGSETAISYCCPKFSSDGQLMVYSRDIGMPYEGGYNYTFEVWLYNMVTGENRLLMDQRGHGYDWEPGTQRLTYSKYVPEGYFTTRGEINADLAQGLWSIDLYTNSEPVELVRPESGFWIVNPQWSEDGRYLGFEEVRFYEGRGTFAYWDVANQQYVSWSEAIGAYDWAPNGELLAYDTQTYAPQGIEQIWISDPQETSEYVLSPLFTPGYASSPAISPDGVSVAYLVAKEGPEARLYTIFIQPVAGGEPRELGEFVYAQYLQWTPDGAHLLLSIGDFGYREVAKVSVADGTTSILAGGDQPNIP